MVGEEVGRWLIGKGSGSGRVASEASAGPAAAAASREGGIAGMVDSANGGMPAGGMVASESGGRSKTEQRVELEQPFQIKIE